MKKMWKSPYVSGLSGSRLTQHHRIAALPYFNSRPLIAGLDDVPEIDLCKAAPCDTREMLASGQIDAAILPTIDLQRSSSPLTVLPAGCIASAGTVLTVRIFSQVRPVRIHTLWVDNESHTSVALAQVLWYQLFKRRLHVIPFSPDRWDIAEDAQAVLMIGDKVVTSPPIGYDFQFDLGRMWFEMTGLPFVFAVWAAGQHTDHDELFQVLSAARRDGQDNLDEIARRCAPLHGWPEDLAHRYYNSNLQFDFTDAHREGMEEFFELASEIGIIPANRRIHYHGM